MSLARLDLPVGTSGGSPEPFAVTGVLEGDLNVQIRLTKKDFPFLGVVGLGVSVEGAGGGDVNAATAGDADEVMHWSRWSGVVSGAE